MPDPTPKSNNYSEQEHDDLFAAMYPGRVKPERAAERPPEDGRVRANPDRLRLSEVTARYPEQAQRDELVLAFRLQESTGERYLSDDEMPFAVVLAEEEDRRLQLAELTAAQR